MPAIVCHANSIWAALRSLWLLPAIRGHSPLLHPWLEIGLYYQLLQGRVDDLTAVHVDTARQLRIGPPVTAGEA